MWRALVIAVGVCAVGACGGQPVGSKVPRANPTDVAVVAAAAATALTLANPQAAGHKPESDEQKELKPQKVSKKPMPGDVLDRAEQNPESDDEDEDDADLPPCPKPDKAVDPKKVDLFPTPAPAAPPKRCREVAPAPLPD